jgi:hypothetical protein
MITQIFVIFKETLHTLALFDRLVYLNIWNLEEINFNLEQQKIEVKYCTAGRFGEGSLINEL